MPSLCHTSFVLHLFFRDKAQLSSLSTLCDSHEAFLSEAHLEYPASRGDKNIAWSLGLRISLHKHEQSLKGKEGVVTYGKVTAM